MGEWRESEIGYLKANRTYCDLCGQLIPGRYWLEEVEGEEHVFCTPGHEEKYRTYWLPRWRSAGVDSAGKEIP
jgi:hypothetical protein